jgi:hypothetical protein
MPDPCPRLVGSSLVTFVRESLPGRAVLTGLGPGERGPVVVGPVRVGVLFWRRGGPDPLLAVMPAAHIAVCYGVSSSISGMQGTLWNELAQVI